MEPVSPELVLVDPALANSVRSRLRPPDGHGGARRDLVEVSRRASLARRSAEILAGARPHRVVKPSPLAGSQQAAATCGTRRRRCGRRTRHRSTDRSSHRAGRNAGGRRHDGRRPSSLTSAPEDPSVERRPACPHSTTTGEQAKPRAKPQRFAWAPTAGASGYHVELFLGSSRVFDEPTRSVRR